jgi:hypothetical protein
MSTINATQMNLFNVITRLTQVMNMTFTNKWHSETKTMQTMKNSIVKKVLLVTRMW